MKQPRVQKVQFGKGLSVLIPHQKLQENTVLYLAGPHGFSELTRSNLASLTRLIQVMCGKVKDPWKLTNEKLLKTAQDLPYGKERQEKWKEINAIIALNNENGIRESTGVIACLDGVDVDSGTATEIGIAYMLGLPILGYRTDFRLSADNEGSDVNLQVQGTIERSGSGKGRIVRSIKEVPDALLAIWG